MELAGGRRKAAENQMKRQQAEMAQNILEKYDADQNGTLRAMAFLYVFVGVWGALRCL